MAHRELGVTGAGHLVFANNRLVSPQALDASTAGSGIIFDTLQNALLKHGDLVKAHLLAQPSKLGSDKFAALHEAFLEDGAFIYVPKGVTATMPVGVFHYASGAGTAVFPHTLVIAEDNAKVTVADFFPLGEGEGSPLLPAAATTSTPATARRSPTSPCRTGAARRCPSSSTPPSPAATPRSSRSTCTPAPARRGTSPSPSWPPPGAHSEMLALTVAHGTQEFDQRTLQLHQAPNTTSNLLYKNALLDQSKTIFSGLIVVDPDAQKTDAYQSNRNLMLSDEAEANSLPGLEIQANDVRCTHGATSARIDREQEFYLESRGIRAAQAQELLVFGFFEEVLGKIEHQELHDTLTDIIREKFRT